MRIFVTGLIVGAAAVEVLRRAIAHSTAEERSLSRQKLRFAKDLMNEHDALMHGLFEIELNLAAPPADPPEEDRRTETELELLRAKLEQHFQSPDVGKRFQELVQAFPQLAGLVDHLKRHHRALVDQLGEICAFAGKAEDEAQTAELRTRLHAFSARLREHERHLFDLFLEAYGSHFSQGD